MTTKAKKVGVKQDAPETPTKKSKEDQKEDSQQEVVEKDSQKDQKEDQKEEDQKVRNTSCLCINS